MPRLVTIIGGKGGIGKTTLAAGLLLAATRAGAEAAGLDLDTYQTSLADWAAERDRQEFAPSVPVAAADLASWRSSLPSSSLVIVDTPPARDPETRATLAGVVAASALALVPARPSLVDLRALVPIPSGAVWVLNAVGRESAELAAIREWLAERGEVCPVEVPARAHLARELGTGEGPELTELWAWAARRLGA